MKAFYQHKSTICIALIFAILCMIVLLPCSDNEPLPEPVAPGASGDLVIKGYNEKSAVTVVVAASDSGTEAREGADYICDGTADDVQIQAAIDGLPAAGGMVQLLEGTYSYTVLMTLDDNVSINGQGKSTVLLAGSPVSCFRATNKSNINISNLKIDGNSFDGLWGIDLQNTSNVDISNVDSFELNDHHVRVYGASASNVTISNCYMRESNDEIISISGTASMITVANNMFAGAANSGLLIYGGANNIKVIGNTISDMGIAGIRSQIMHDILIEGNTIYDNLKGITSTSLTGGHSDNVTVVGNNLFDNTNYGLSMEADNAREWIIIGNNIYNNDKEGCNIRGTYGVFDGNVVVNNSQGSPGALGGIDVVNAQYWTITNNNASDYQGTPTQKSGVREFGTSDYNLIQGNLVVGNITYDIEPSGSNTIVRGNFGHTGTNELLDLQINASYQNTPNFTDGGDISFTATGGTVTATINTGAVADAEIDYSAVTLGDFDYQTAWRLFYSNTDGDVTELALGSNGEYLKSQGASSAPTWDTPAGGGTQNVWAKLIADSGSTTANTTTDEFTITGGDNITTSISGDVVTITSAAGGTPSWEVEDEPAAGVADGPFCYAPISDVDVVFGNALHINDTDSNYAQADKDAWSTAPVAAIAGESGTGAAQKIFLPGSFITVASGTIATEAQVFLYMGDDGLISTGTPSGSGDIFQCLGWSTGTATWYFDPYLPMEIN